MSAERDARRRGIVVQLSYGFRPSRRAAPADSSMRLHSFRCHGCHGEGINRPTEAFEIERPEGLGDDAVLQPAKDALADHDLPRARQGTQARGEVHDAPDRGVPVVPLETDSTHGRKADGQPDSEPHVESTLLPSRGEFAK